MGLKVVGCGDAVEVSWEEVEVLERGAEVWTVVPRLPLVAVLGTAVVVDPAVEAISRLEEEGMTELVGT